MGSNRTYKKLKRQFSIGFWTVLLIGLFSFSGNAQVVCTDFTITGTTTTNAYFLAQDANCTISPLPVGLVVWTQTPLNGFPNGFITHTFNDPQTNVSIWYTVINTDDFGTITVNGGGVVTMSLVSGCADIVGNVLGPYTGTGSYGDVLVNIQSTNPFTEVTLVNTGGQSGQVSGDCNSVIIEPGNPCEVQLGSDTTLCSGETFTLDATTANATYLWQDNSTDPTFNVSQEGTYWVQVTVDDCIATDTVQVNYNSLPTIDLGADAALCDGESLLLDATTDNASYLWQDQSTAATFEVTQEGSYWVVVEVNGCQSGDTINVEYNSPASLSLGDDTTLCSGETLTLDATTTNATYLWQDNSTSPVFNVSQQGTYWVQVTLDGCLASDTIQVNYNSLPTIDLGADTVLCEGESLLLDATTADATYQWQDNSNNPVFEVTQEGTYWVLLEVDGCQTADSIHVDYISLESHVLGDDTTLCSGETLTLDATTSNATYLWQDNSTAPVFNVSQQGTYWVQITVNSCLASDTIQVNYNSLPTIDLGADTVLCEGESLLLDATTANASYQWQDQSTAATLEVTQEGTYSVVVEVNNCQASDAIIVEYVSSANIDLGHDDTLCLEESLILDATTEGATYLWQDSSSNSSYQVTEEGTYWVEVTVNGCEVNPDPVTIHYEDCNIYVYIPNAFTPNGDGHNDIFKPSITGGDIESYEMLIVNRWGEVIFESAEIDLGWNGAGARSSDYFGQNEVYIYYIRLKGRRSFTEEYSGHVTLIR